ncbi:hypothetical protein DPV73_01765 [Leptospira mayottensis]|nr:hypothetical protein DPV73_01765 [Leptospira mayottensis]
MKFSSYHFTFLNETPVFRTRLSTVGVDPTACVHSFHFFIFSSEILIFLYSPLLCQLKSLLI